MTIPASKSSEENYVAELYPNVVDVAAIYGDPQGKYISFLNAGDPTYATDAYFLWDQPLPGGEKESAAIGKNATSSGGVTTNNKSSSDVMINGRNLFGVMICATALGSILGM